MEKNEIQKVFSRVDLDPARYLANIAMPNPSNTSAHALKQLKEIAENELASEFCRRLNEYCKEFDDQLDAEHEIGARLVSYGPSVMLYVESISYYNPSLICFDGVLDDGKTPVQLIQNVSQINFLLMALPKKDPNKPKHPFGFEGNIPQ